MPCWIVPCAMLSWVLRICLDSAADCPQVTGPVQRHTADIKPKPPSALVQQAPAAMVLISAQELRGGPRAGKGAAVRTAMCASATGCRTCVINRGAGSRRRDSGGGAAPPRCTHSGQSSIWLRCSCVPSSVSTRSLTSPAPEQTSCTGCGLTNGDAVATPMDKANHASIKQARARRWRRVCMERDCSGGYGSFSQTLAISGATSNRPQPPCPCCPCCPLWPPWPPWPRSSKPCSPLARCVRCCTAVASSPGCAATSVNAWRARVMPV